MLQSDEWRDIPGYEGLYRISKSGKIVSYPKQRNRREVELKPRFTWDGYFTVGLWKNGSQKTYKIHKLVAMTFIPNPNGFPVINHIDGCKTNNDVSNLEWCTRSDNDHHAFKMGLRTSPFAKEAKLTKEDVKYIRQNHRIHGAYPSASDLSKQFGVSKACIYSVIEGRRWKNVL